jgi:hypothetical protein
MQTRLNITEDDIYADIKQFIETFFPGEVIQANSNNIPPPMGDFVVMSLLFDTPLSATVNDYDAGAEEAYVQRYVQVSMQLDFYGEQCGRYKTIFETLWRNFYACDRLTICQPLDVVSVMRSPIVNDTSNYEQRWIVTANLQVNPVVTHDQEFITDMPIKINHLKGQ